MSNDTVPRRIIIGITGATGVALGARALTMLRELKVESHLVVSRAGEMTRAYETDMSRDELCSLADRVHPINDVGAAISSGSFRTMGMLIAPCTVSTLGEVANGISSSLLTRAADVVLKEQRKLVMLVREAPLHATHLRNMLRLAEMGAVISPPVITLYNRPSTISDMIDHTVARALEHFGLDVPGISRWGESDAGPRDPRRTTSKEEQACPGLTTS
jgi:4-hydroxy-3-polyprenylbenzoate decarboxylase